MKNTILLLGITLLVTGYTPDKPSDSSDITVLKELRRLSIHKMQELSKKITEEKGSVAKVPDN